MIIPPPSTKIGLTTYVEVIQVTPLVGKFTISTVILGSSKWQNPGNRFDVMGDGVVDINDYNAIANYIATHGSGPLPKNRSANQPYVDVSGDGIVDDRDINQLLAYMQNKKLVDTTQMPEYNITDIKLERDLVDPTTVATAKDVAAQKNIFPTNDYLVFKRDLSTNDLTEIAYSTPIASRDSLVFINKQVIVPVHPFTPGCYNDSCVFGLIKARIAASEILPIRFNKTIGVTEAVAGSGLPLPGMDTSEMPVQPVVAEQVVPTITYVEQTTVGETITSSIEPASIDIAPPPVVILDIFPSPCVIIGEIKLVCMSTDGSNNAETTTCTAKMTSNTTPAPYVASADSERSESNPTHLGQYVFRSYRYGVQQIETTLDPTTSDFYHWIGGNYEINWALAGGDSPSRMAGFIDPRTIPGAYLICIEDQSPPRSSVFDACVLVRPLSNGKVSCLQNGESNHTYTHKLFGPNGDVVFDPFAHGNAWTTWEEASFFCPAWKAFNRSSLDENDIWASQSTPFPHYLQYDFYTAVVINKYAIQERNSFNYVGFPKDFSLQASNDEITWDTLDTRVDISAPGPASWSDYFSFNNGTAYRYYRLSIAAVVGGGTATNIAELKLICISVDGANNAATNACTTIMASNTVPEPNVVSATSEYYSEYRSTYYSAWKAFSGTNLGESDRWISATSIAPWYIQYDFGVGHAVAINKYAIQEQNYNGTTVVNGEIINEQNYNSGDGFPRDFTFQGSHDGINWIILDTRINTEAPGINAWTPYFTFSNGVAYRYYKIHITTVNGQLSMPITGTTSPTDCTIVVSSNATIRNVVITQYDEAERTTPIFQTAGQSQTTLYSGQELIITFNAYDLAKGVYSASLWLDGVRIPITTNPHTNTSIGGVDFNVAIGQRAAGVHSYTIVAINNDGVSTTPPYTCWFTVLQGGA